MRVDPPKRAAHHVRANGWWSARCRAAPRTAGVRRCRTTRPYRWRRRRSVPRQDGIARRRERQSAPLPFRSRRSSPRSLRRLYRGLCLDCAVNCALDRMREAVQRGVAIDLARGKPRGREVGPVGRIGPGVRFEAHGIGLPIEAAALSGGGAVEKVSGIDLQPGLVGEQLEHAAGRWLSEPRGKARLAAGRAETEIVIVAAADPQAADGRCGSARRSRRRSRKSNGVSATALGGCGSGIAPASMARKWSAATVR